MPTQTCLKLRFLWSRKTLRNASKDKFLLMKKNVMKDYAPLQRQRKAIWQLTFEPYSDI